MSHLRIAAVIAALLCVGAGNPLAQEPAASPPAGPLVPLQIQVVVAKYRGDKRVSSLPYTISVNANSISPSSLRMGAEVPVPSGAFPPGPDGKPVGPVNYRRIGTNIDCFATTVDAGRFAVNLTIEDTSVYVGSDVTAETPRVNNMPVFRSFRSQNTLILREGQTTQFTAATDRVSGEITRVDVTLTVVK